MGTQVLQPSFSAGEFSPKLFGRVDLARYAVALATCRNFVVLPEGGIQNRAGTRFLALTGDGLPDQRLVRMVAFRFSVGQAYALEIGERYMRFFANAAPVQVEDVAAWSGATTYARCDFAVRNGVTYKSKQDANTNHDPAVSPAWWVAQTALEIATPWIGQHAMELRHTQSADVMTFTHDQYPPMQLRRLGASQFELVAYDYREGPFVNLNVDDAVVVSSSGRTGVVTVTSNAPIFTADMVGSNFYMELRDLSQIKPWVPGDRSVVAGLLRRSDGKTYKAVTVPPNPGGGSWTETGTRAPIHDQGRAWDGPGDSRSNGSVTAVVGIEWEYRDSGYGIVRFTGYTDAYTMTAEVKRTLPDQIVGGVGTPAASWNLTGDGVTKTFAIAGATGTTREYSVTISGSPVASSPPYSGGGNGGSGSPGGGLP